MCALELARSGAEFKACATVHGILKKSELETKHIHPQVMILHGFLDPQVPKEDLFHLAEELSLANQNKWQFISFGDAKHAFSDPKTGSFDPAKEALMGREFNKDVALKTFDFLTYFFKKELF